MPIAMRSLVNCEALVLCVAASSPLLHILLNSLLNMLLVDSHFVFLTLLVLRENSSPETFY